MSLQSPTAIEKNKTAQLIVSVILAVSIVSFFVITRIRTPDVRSVYGTYHNDCCRDIVINANGISYGASTAPFRLLNMKFGLTGYVKGRFTRAGIVQADDEASISFSGDTKKRAISLPVEGREYTFKLASVPLPH